MRDLRLLTRVLRLSKLAPEAESEPHALLGPVVLRVSELAASTLSLLCSELAAGQGSKQAGLPDLELFASPAADADGPLGIRTLNRIPIGQLVCFYPGRIFDPDEPNLPMGDKVISNEYEGVYLDGKGWLPAQWSGHPLLANEARPVMHKNRMAVGNLLNHPPKGMLPNCVPIAFRWPSWQELGESSPAFWARLIPHVGMRDGRIVRTASGDTTLPDSEKVWFPPFPHMGLAFIALQTVHPGSELYLNYRLHPRRDSEGLAEFPSWYSPVDEDQLENAIAAELEAGETQAL